MSWKTQLHKAKENSERLLAVLIDPDQADTQQRLEERVRSAEAQGANLFFVGGSLVSSSNFKEVILRVKSVTALPVIIFPGNFNHIHEEADGLLLLNLVSGRNADFLIGQHVLAAPLLAESRLKLLSTGYILIAGGSPTTVEYISNTRPIPANKPDIAVATALASQLIGHDLIYLDAGSGADHAIPVEVIYQVAQKTRLPLIVGGGIRSAAQANAAWRAGANIIVVGNALENKSELLKEIAAARP